MKPMNGLLAIGLALAMAMGTLACEQEKGTMEKAGEKVDDAADDLMHPGEGPFEEATRKAGEQLDELEEDLSD